LLFTSSIMQQDQHTCVIERHALGMFRGVCLRGLSWFGRGLSLFLVRVRSAQCRELIPHPHSLPCKQHIHS
jgi:hypothetical protein